MCPYGVEDAVAMTKPRQPFTEGFMKSITGGIKEEEQRLKEGCITANDTHQRTSNLCRK